MISLNKLSMGVFNDTQGFATNQKNVENSQLEKLDLKTIIQTNFPDDQYVKEQTNKTQIVLHHTVSGPNADNVVSWWLSTPDKIATAMVVDTNGRVIQNFSSKYWAWHLGIKTIENTPRNKGSVGVEMVAWGGLVNYRDNWYPAIWDAKLKKNVANIKVKPIVNVQVYDKQFRGFYGFEKYSDAQIEAVRKLLIFWNEKYGIPLDYNPTMWDLSRDALGGKPGIWTHVSYRLDKSDCHPQPELIQMLQSLK